MATIQETQAPRLALSLQLKTKRLLLVAASRDDIVPPAAMRQLWRATGEPKILWVDATHVGSAQFVFPMMNAVLAHVLAENPK